MNKALVIISDNNKGKYTAKGFSDAFKALSFFVYERKIPDLNENEIIKIKPDIVFVFWTDMHQKEELKKFLSSDKFKDIEIMHCAERNEDIPRDFKTSRKHFVFTQSNDKYNFRHGIDATAYKTKFEGYKYGITFAGNPSQAEREEILSELIKNYGPINIFCRSYDFYKSLDEIREKKLLDKNFEELYRASYGGYIESAKELSEIFSSSKINLDMKDEDKDSLNYRCLEITASGGFLIMPDTKNNINFFTPGKEAEIYENKTDLIDKIDFYLKNLNIAAGIALNGKKRTVTNYTSKNELKRMLKEIYGKDIDSGR